MHPASRLAAFILIAVSAPLLAPAAAAALCVALLAALLWRGHFAQFLRVLWRSKFVLLALLLAHLLGSELNRAALLGVLLNLLALITLLAALVLLVLAQPREQLLCGLVSVLQPLARLGVDSRALCVRLALTLDYAGAARAQPWRELLREVMQGDAATHTRAADGSEAAEVILVPRRRWGWRDAVFFSALLLGALALGVQSLVVL